MHTIKFIFLLSTFFLFTQYAYPQSDSTTLFIRNGSSVQIIVGELYKTGLLSSQGQGVSFRVIDSIWTADSSLANEIPELYPGVKARESDRGFVLVFPVIESPAKTSIASSPVPDTSFPIDASENISSPIDSTILYIKNGLPVHVVISEIYDRAIIDSNDRGISYRVIDSLWTSDGTAARKINEILRGAAIRDEKRGYLLDLTSVKLPEYKRDTTVFARLRTHSYIYSPSTSHRIGIQLDNKLFSLNCVILRFEGAIGFRSNLAPFSYINYNAGLGYELENERLLFKAVIGYGVYAQEKDLKTNTGTGSVVFISPSIHIKIAGESNILFLAGVNALLYRSMKDIPENQIMLYAGFGFLLE